MNDVEISNKDVNIQEEEEEIILQKKYWSNIQQIS